ncbi:DUF3014 domain-containing protein [Microbulbifer sp. 2205BS26-8]|uniref:DUF3014 domain-containing protein n=1 Tax=Microbulbifer sp. 2205BS26-8 TaxID=3064386 RepID=UPI00273E9258|nr:DUF3014 domain-containing protein [Microbulbifer sp. 2205BS26-8]MDP5208537.1 DUF3014 domain-containing protein [Microbulbifer sp. 2205BS26-8]
MSEQQSRQGWIIGIIVVIIVAAAAYWLWTGDEQKKEIPSTTIIEQPKTAPEPETLAQPQEQAPEPKPPEPAPAEEPGRAPPPPLNNSDKSAYQDLMGLAPDNALSRWLVPSEVIRKWVAAINAGSRGTLIYKHRPLRKLRGPILVTGSSVEGYQLSPSNYRRYDQPVRLLALMNTEAAVGLYQYWYPRLAQAYAELGIRNKTFHQVVLEAIDKVLAAPEIEGPIQLVRPSVYYKFADPKLEKLPGVQKLMIRMGPENTIRVKEKLKELREKLETVPVQQPQSNP